MYINKHEAEKKYDLSHRQLTYGRGQGKLRVQKIKNAWHYLEEDCRKLADDLMPKDKDDDVDLKAEKMRWEIKRLQNQLGTAFDDELTEFQEMFFARMNAFFSELRQGIEDCELNSKQTKKIRSLIDRCATQLTDYDQPSSQ